MKKTVAIILCIGVILSLAGCDIGGGATTVANTEPDCQHNYSAATCTAPQTCANCGETIGTTIDHCYGEFAVVKQPTCTTNGVKERSCSMCGAKQSEDIATVDHTWINATCASPKKCSVCGTTEGEATPHTAIPDANWKCGDCGQTIYTSNYKYIASSDFRNIKRTYASAVAQHAYISAYRQGDKAYVLVDVYYTIGSKKFNDVILHNLSEGTKIEDPISYYGELADRAYGNTKLYYMDVRIDIQQILADQYSEGYMVDGDYLNTYS